jgi:hypothetical protein
MSSIRAVQTTFDFIMYARGCKEKSSIVLGMNKQCPQNTRMSVRYKRKRENGGGGKGQTPIGCLQLCAVCKEPKKISVCG